MIHDEIVTYEVAKLAKEKGFPQDECGVNIGYYAWDGLRKTHPLVNSFAWYNDEYNHDNLFLASTQSLLQRWLREEKKLHITINSAYEWGVDDLQYTQERNISVGIGAFGLFDTYEDALEDALKYSLENLV